MRYGMGMFVWLQSHLLFINWTLVTILNKMGYQIDEDGTIIRDNKKEVSRKPLIGAIIGVALAVVVALIVVVSSKSHRIRDNCSFAVGGVSFTMKKVDGGSFIMGADKYDSESKDWEKPAHRVTLDSYFIGETEVTQKLWKKVMGYNPSKHVGDNYPVECVSWNDCIEFCQRLSEKTGRRFRLPTEAEWEFAARGGNQSKGYRFSGSNYLEDVAWSLEISDSISHPVRQKQPNELGLYDMTGNAWEICSDLYARYTGESEYNPQGPSTSEKGRVRRGGGWLNRANYSRVSYRYYTPHGQRNDFLGFRLAMDCE